MERNELIELSQQIKDLESLKKHEKQLTDAVRNYAADKSQVVSTDAQSIINKAVNSFAVTLSEEIGGFNDEMVKILERVRIVSDRTVQRDRKKTASAESGKKQNN